MVAGSNLVGYSVVLHDSTMRKELLDGLRLAVQARDEFLSIASHELKTPLASIVLQLGAVEKLTRDGATTVPTTVLAPKFQILARQVDRLRVLVDNLLDVTRITSGRLELARARTELRDVVRSVLVRMEQTIERSGSVVTLVAESSLFGFWDPVRIDTVVVNLLSNAIKYGRGRPVRIELGAENGRARLTVTDGGIGIPAADRERIFERFERAVPVQHYGGFGIGLWVVRQIVEAHGGSIAVSSTEGQGSVFRVELPLEAAAPRAQ
jgi:signal transduction histidine kinase